MSFSHSELLSILRMPAHALCETGSYSDRALFAHAAARTRASFGDAIFQRGVIEFSSICRKNCHFCGLRHDNTALSRFRLSTDDILQAAREAVAHGMGTIVLQCGEDPAVAPETIARLVETIKKYCAVPVTLSLGDHPAESYRMWRDSGADRYLLKIETTNDALHARLRPGQSVATRLKNINTLQQLGYETGSGIITGLPGMTPEILTGDILHLSSLGLEMLAAGPFVPHPQTPLGTHAHGGMAQSLRVTALLRLQNPGANIPATSALDVLAPQGRLLALQAGANVIMPSFTPRMVRSAYTIYPGKNRLATEPLSLQVQLREAGYYLSSAAGTSSVQPPPAFSQCGTEPSHM